MIVTVAGEAIHVVVAEEIVALVNFLDVLVVGMVAFEAELVVDVVVESIWCCFI